MIGQRRGQCLVYLARAAYERFAAYALNQPPFEPVERSTAGRSCYMNRKRMRLTRPLLTLGSAESRRSGMTVSMHPRITAADPEWSVTTNC